MLLSKGNIGFLVLSEAGGNIRREALTQHPQEAVLEPQASGVDSPLGLVTNSPPSLPDQFQNPPSSSNPPGAAAQEDADGHHSATMVWSLENVGSATPQTPSSAPLQASEPCPNGPSSSPPGGSLLPWKRLGSPLDNPRPARLPKRAACIPSSSSAAPNHFFDFHGVALQSYGALYSSFEAVSGSSSRIGQLEGELKALKEEKAREEGVLRHHLKNL
ncbi:hypothetical protein LIER_11648 [Lithospermum erythrorhizon]|uniref:Uncharacterized protein n=1 Tax=Lithospermum erythrorhizon TaxID=34254 RepID=A0AAV3PNV5_LITER